MINKQKIWFMLEKQQRFENLVHIITEQTLVEKWTKLPSAKWPLLISQMVLTILGSSSHMVQSSEMT